MSSLSSASKKRRGLSVRGKSSVFSPTLETESALGFPKRLVIGLDEVGRGCLAGPVTVGAVVLPLSLDLPEWTQEIRDSKLLSEAQRESLAPRIREWAASWAIGSASVEEIAQWNILGAVGLAMKRAVDAIVQSLDGSTDFRILIDGNRIPTCFSDSYRQQSLAVVKGDQRCLSVAAASILAKVDRDSLMMDYEKRYPGYGFGVHKSYGTPAHLDAVKRLGVLPVHRAAFAPIRALLESGVS